MGNKREGNKWVGNKRVGKRGGRRGWGRTFWFSGLRETEASQYNFFLVSMSHGINSISCYVRMPHALILKTKTTNIIVLK